MKMRIDNSKCKHIDNTANKGAEFADFYKPGV